jgi:hypothetical protein
MRPSLAAASMVKNCGGLGRARGERARAEAHAERRRSRIASILAPRLGALQTRSWRRPFDGCLHQFRREEGAVPGAVSVRAWLLGKGVSASASGHQSPAAESRAFPAGFACPFKLDAQVLKKYYRRVKTGVRGLGIVRTNTATLWPSNPST